MIHKCNNSSISQAVAILKSSGIVAIPTDTLYGLSANAFDSEAIEKIYKIKHRPHTKPMIVLVSNLNDINGLAHYDDRLEKLAKAFWPGPLTVLLNRVKNEHKLARPV
jgi:L-threonylcarbamoyladenylate synthase